MENVARLLEANARGDPIEKSPASVIPIFRDGFGYCAGRRENRKSAGGANIRTARDTKPSGGIILDDQRARLESVRGAAPILAQTLGLKAGKITDEVADLSTPTSASGEPDHVSRFYDKDLGDGVEGND